MYKSIAQGCGVAQNTSRDVGRVHETLGFPRDQAGTGNVITWQLKSSSGTRTRADALRGHPRAPPPTGKSSDQRVPVAQTEPPHGGLTCDNAPRLCPRERRRGHTSHGRVPSDSQRTRCHWARNRAPAGTAGRMAGQRSGHVLLADCERDREEGAEQDAHGRSRPEGEDDEDADETCQGSLLALLARGVPRVPMSPLVQGPGSEA
jgi:hypothetical protein